MGIEEQDVEEFAPDSSDGAQTLDVADKAAEVAKPDAEQSSGSNDVSEGKDTLSVVRDVVDESRAAPEKASSAEGEEKTQDGDSPTTNKEPDDENFSDVPFGKHPRFQKLLRQRNEFKGAAEQYQQITSFMETHGLQAEEAANALVIAGLTKSNPIQAWERLKPLVQRLLTASGEVLPDDLKGRVENGEMSRDAALDVSRSRAQVESMRTGQTFAEQQAQRQQQTQTIEAMRNEAGSWEQDRTLKDPNFASKLPLIQREVAWLQQNEGRPSTPQGVREQLDKAYKAVNDALPPPRPVLVTRQPTRPVTSSTSAGSADPAPTTTMGILKNVVAKHRAGAA